VIQKLKTSTYFRVHPESFTRTIIDILLCSRLEVLGDNTANRRLRVHSEVLITTKTRDNGRIGSITDRADWVLGWGTKEDIENITLIVEAKAEGLQTVALPQLFA
jgi:hypothetical protein